MGADVEHPLPALPRKWGRGIEEDRVRSVDAFIDTGIIPGVA